MVLIIILIVLLLIIKILDSNKIEKFSNLYIINKIEPQFIYNPNSKIAFLYAYTPNIFSYCQYSLLNVLKYAEKYDYSVIIYDKMFNNEVAPCWNKIAGVIENIKKYDYLVWIDADAIIVNFNITIESIINKNPNYDLYICYDIIIQKECINSGVMIIKNTEWNYNLFMKTWKNPNPHYHNDQNILFYEIIKDLYPYTNPDLKFSNYCMKINHPKVKILSENVFNTHILNYNHGDFIIHLMGMSENVRIDIMRQINTMLNIDNYEKKECLEILKMNNDATRIFFVEKICLNK